MTRPRTRARPPSAVAQALLGALALAAASPLAAQDSAAPEAFREEFDGPLDPARWYVSDGWSNGEWMACAWSARMLSIADGALRLTLAPAGAGSQDWLCGELQTHALHQYGTFEARIRSDAGSGVNAAFFTYIGPVHGQPHDEIDVEILTRDTGRFDVNTYVGGEPRNGATVPVEEPTDAGFRTYAFTWEPERIRWYLDGALVHEATGPDIPQGAQKIFLSHWNSRTFVDWMGPFEDPGRPLVMQVDWLAWTPLGESCAFPESVLCGEGAP